MRTILTKTLIVTFALLYLGNTALAQVDQPMPPPAPEGDNEDPKPPTLPKPPAARAKTSGAAAHHSTDVNNPVVRATAGLWALGWGFGGFGSMTFTGRGQTITNGNAGTLIISQLSVTYVLSQQWRIPFYFGTGLRLQTRDGVDASPWANWGLDMGGGFEYHFRIWRRISPFVGALLGIGITDPSGDSNLVFKLGLGPQVGVEYFLGDRVSLQAVYEFMLDFAFTDGAMAFQFGTSSGGVARIKFYF